MAQSENIYNLKGLSYVFRFSLAQIFKSKAHIISLVIMILLMWFIGPTQMISKIKSENYDIAEQSLDADEIQSIKGIVVFNGTAVDIDEDDIATGLCSDLSKVFIAVVNDEADFEEDLTEYENSVVLDSSLGADITAKDALITVYIGVDYTTGSYVIDGVISDDSIISDSTLESILDMIKTRFDEVRYINAGVSDDEVTLTIINNGIKNNGVYTESSYKTEMYEEYDENEVYMLSYQFVMLVLIMLTLSVQYIITSVMEEKSSRLAETILVSVRPLALIMGKIFAVMCYIFAIVVPGCIGSLIINRIIENVTGIDTESFIDFSIAFTKGVGVTLLMIVSLVLTYMIFAIFAGIMGSACAKTEDIQASVQTVSFINVVVALIAMMVPAYANNTLIKVLSIIPPFSCYIAPSSYLVGKISLGFMFISIVIQLIVVALLFMLCAKVYRVLILRDNKKAKIKDIIEIARSKGAKVNV